MWVVYAHPLDYPQNFVLRRWELRDRVLLPTNEVSLGMTFEEIRAALPPGLYWLPRFAGDDPCIVEVWL